MIDDKTIATTAEICSLVGFTKQRLGGLERDAVVQRVGRDAWPLVATIRKLFEHAKAQRSAQSEARSKLLAAQQRLADLRYQRAAAELVTVADYHSAIAMLSGWFVAALERLPATAPARADPALRKELEAWVYNTRTELADKCQAEVAAIEKGKAAR
jgi:hypothetical protein